jgi:hypothetical protein
MEINPGHFSTGSCSMNSLKAVLTNDGKNSGVEQVGGDREFKTHVVNAREITKTGYLYVYVSNETPNLDVFFDGHMKK